MEFSYRVTEAEYRQAFKLRMETGFLDGATKKVMLWVFILVCLLLLWTVVQRSAAPHPDVEAVAPVALAPTSTALLINVGPFLVLAGVWFFVMFRLRPLGLRRAYRKDPSMQGEFTVSITPASVTITNSAGSSYQAVWNYYDYWREGKGISVLVYKTGAYSPISLANLTEPDRAELRGILASVLPKK